MLLRLCRHFIQNCKFLFLATFLISGLKNLFLFIFFITINCASEHILLLFYIQYHLLNIYLVNTGIKQTYYILFYYTCFYHKKNN